MMAKPGKETDLDRILSMLRSLLRYAELSHREVEKRLGASPNSGYLSRLLNGSRELKLRQLLDILEVVAMPPGNFFRAAFPKAAEDGHGARLQKMLENIHPAPTVELPSPMPEMKLEEEQLERLLRRTLRKILSEDEEETRK